MSCVSARHVLAAAAAGRYEVEPIGITRDGRWVLAEAARTALEGDHDSMPDRLEAVGPEVQPLETLAGSGVAPTVVLPVLHGPMGEDGTVQVCSNSPGCRTSVLVSSPRRSAWTRSPARTISPATDSRSAPIDGSRSTTASRRPDGNRVHLLTEVDAAINKLGLPMFVKPANMGSSVGVSGPRPPMRSQQRSSWRRPRP